MSRSPTLIAQNENNSRYVRVSSVTSPTPNYFDNNGTAKAQYTASIPINSSGSFGSATGTIGSNAKFYDQIKIFKAILDKEVENYKNQEDGIDVKTCSKVT